MDEEGQILDVETEVLDEAEAEERLSLWAKNQTELAAAIGCDRKTIQRWLKEGDAECPGKRADGRYNVTLWRLWAEKKGKNPKNRLGKDKGALEIENYELRNEALKIANAVKRGELIHIDDCSKVLCEMVSAFVTRVRGMKHTLGPEVIGVPLPEAVKRIGREVDDALRELSLGEWAKKKPFWGSVYATLLDLRKSFSLGDGQNAT